MSASAVVFNRPMRAVCRLLNASLKISTAFTLIRFAGRDDLYNVFAILFLPGMGDQQQPGHEKQLLPGIHAEII